MDLGNQIASYRKVLNITQEALAQKLGVTNQAVSKWESNQCCPDVQLLPKLADIFEITLDQLFGRQGSPSTAQLPWEDDETLRVVVYIGHKLVTHEKASQTITFHYEGEALAIDSAVSVDCGDVQGSVHAGAAVKCGNVQGSAHAGSDVYCGNVSVDARAGYAIYCGNVFGNAKAGADIYCGKVGGHVTAGGIVTIKE